MPAMLQPREVLRYIYPDYDLVVWDREIRKHAGIVKHGEIVVVVNCESSASIKILTMSGQIGWIFYNPQRLLKMEHCPYEGDL